MTLLAGLFGILIGTMSLALADLLTLPLRIVTGEALFNFLNGVLS